MTKDEIIKLARQAEMIQMTIGEWWGVELNDIENFARLVAEKEREACAKIADEYAKGLERNYSEIIADEIRARKQA